MRTTSLALLALAASCAQPDAVSTVSQPTIYGTDDRLDPYEHPDTRLRELAEQSAVVLVSDTDVFGSNPANVTLTPTTLGAQEGLCAGQRFINDPSPGFCSGTLIDNDLVITAGHCITNARDCATTRFVFNFYRDAADSLHTITGDDVYACASIVVRARTTTPYRDYAVLRLDRPVTAGHVPAPVHAAHDLLATGDAIAVIGFPSGIPAKIDSGGHVRDPGMGDSFLATTDTFGGNSGSGVYDLVSHEIRGLLLEGDADYDRTSAGCYTVHVCTETGCSGETVGYVWHAIDALCAAVPTALPCSASGDGGVEVDSGTSDATPLSDAAIDVGVPDAASDVTPGTDAANDVPADITTDTPTADVGVDVRRDAAPDGAAFVAAHGGCGCRVAARTAERSPSAIVPACALLAVLSIRRRRRPRA